jgi:hypothetical protein
MSSDDSHLSFEKDIRPMFRDIDIEHMEGVGVLLADHAWMAQPANAKRVLDSLSEGADFRMPPDGPYWSDDQLKRLSDWIEEGCRS